MTSVARMPRGSRPATAFVAALLATCVCAFGAAQAISLATRGRALWFDVHDVTRFGRTTHWNAAVVLAVAIAAAVIGLGLLLAGLLPPRRRIVESSSGDAGLAIGLSQSSLRRSLHAAITGIDGVSGARVRGRHRLRVTATTSLRDGASMAEAIQSGADRQLTALAPNRPHTARVRLKRKDG